MAHTTPGTSQLPGLDVFGEVDVAVVLLVAVRRPKAVPEHHSGRAVVTELDHYAATSPKLLYSERVISLVQPPDERFPSAGDIRWVISSVPDEASLESALKPRKLLIHGVGHAPTVTPDD